MQEGRASELPTSDLGRLADLRDRTMIGGTDAMRLMLFVGGVVLMHICNLLFSIISHDYSIHERSELLYRTAEHETCSGIQGLLDHWFGSGTLRA